MLIVSVLQDSCFLEDNRGVGSSVAYNALWWEIDLRCLKDCRTIELQDYRAVGP